VGHPSPNRPPLPEACYDVIVIGGGINGVAIARECAQAGKRVLILEQNDFASGTSSRSTRIIHGGLRYLEHGEIGLVRESLRERERLLRERAHLVRPVRFLLALPRHENAFTLRNSFAVRAGLWLYGAFGGPKHCPDAKLTPRDLERSLDQGDGWAVFDYEDAQCEFPERLIAEWLVEAVQAGALAMNHTEVLEIEVRERRASAVRTRNRFTGAESRFTATHIINATGPWVDRVCAASSLSNKRMVGGVRGSHILLPKIEGGPAEAIYSEAEDGRPVFLVPWNKQILVGTTEVRDDGDPGDAHPDAEEAAYLLRSAQKMFPQAGFHAGQITAAFSGVRPLPYSPGEKAGAITRRHILHDHAEDGAAGLISVIGGKLTTAASLARQCARKIGVHVLEQRLPVVAKGTASGMESTLQQWSYQIAQLSNGRGRPLARESARAIAEWFGPRALCVIFSASQCPNLQEQIIPGSPHIVAEALHAVRAEHAVTLGDILLRRVPLALSGDWDTESSQTAAERIGRGLGWSASRTADELERFTEERANFMRRPESLAHSGAALGECVA